MAKKFFSEQKILLCMSILLFVISLFGKAFFVEKGREPIGIACLCYGWMAALEGNLAWFAHPFLAGAWTFSTFGRSSEDRKLSAFLATCGLAFALSFLAYSNVRFPGWLNSPPRTLVISGYGTYWIWLASIATMAIGPAAIKFAKLRRSAAIQ